MNAKLFRTGVLGAAVLLSAGAAGAVDTLLAGKRLVITNKLPDNETRNSITMTARSEALGISPPGSTGDPTCAGAGGGGGRITFRSQTSGESYSQELPCENWTGRKTGSWRYNDRALVVGGCKRIEIRTARTLKAICVGRGPSNLDFDLVPGQAQPPVDVTLEVGSGPDRYCMRFAGSPKLDGSNGKKLVLRDSVPPAACPAP